MTKFIVLAVVGLILLGWVGTIVGNAAQAVVEVLQKTSKDSCSWLETLSDRLIDMESKLDTIAQELDTIAQGSAETVSKLDDIERLIESREGD